jgi:uncharacterized protein (TIGR01777 family)
MKKVLITGGTGLIGNRLSELLKEKGYEILLLSRNPKSDAGVKQFLWNIEKGVVAQEAIEQADYIVHLAGEGIAKEKWTASRKKQLLESRTKSSGLLYKALKENPNKVKAVIAATAIGYYGDSGEKLMKEDDKPGKGFLPDLCVAWEKAEQPIAEITRLVQLRIGIVLSSKGGALVELAKPVHFGLGAYIGSGTQYYSWIHIDDLCGIIIHAIENEEVKGVYNAVAPVPVQNKNLVDAIRTSLNKLSVGVPSPPFIIKMMLGEMAAAVLDSCRASSKKIEQAGFKFKFKTPLPALNDLYKRKI